MHFAFEGLEIRLAPECVCALEGRRQIGRGAKEIGGQLFARIEPGLINVVFASVTAGKSRRTRFGFFPDRDAERADVRSHFKAGLHYVGDWHTHPEDIPNPSSTDVHEIRNIFKQSLHELPFMLLVVVGRRAFPEGLFLGAATAGAVVKLTAT